MIDSVENLAIVWASIDRLCSGLPAGQWDLPTGCPGWTVKDQLSHLVDYEARALGRPAPRHEPGPLPHVNNEMGRANEVGVDARRAMSGAAILDEFGQVTAQRLAQLRRLTPGDLAAQTTTPAGPGTVADLLTLRVIDSWSHEQDIRRAVGRPGHTEGPAVEAAVAYFSRFLPYLVGKRAAAPDGAKVVFRIGERPPAAVEVAGGRGRLAADPGDATVNLEVPVATFAALIGGRTDVPADTVISGDQRLGRRVLEFDGLPALTPGPVNGSCWPGSADAGIAVRFPPSRRCAIAASGAGEQAGGGPGSAARARAGKPPVTSDGRTSSASWPCAVPKLIHSEQRMIIV